MPADRKFPFSVVIIIISEHSVQNHDGIQAFARK